MKTNQIMIRSNSSFLQRTKDGYFNANALLDDWNKKSEKKPMQMGNYKKNLSAKAFIIQLQTEGIKNPLITERGKNGGTWMHPKLFIDFAMWVSVEFKSVVIDYVLDGLIKSRHDAGDYYNEMSAAILETHINFFGVKPNPKLYVDEASRIKKLLGLSNKTRNLMTEKELNNITQMQKLNSLLLQKGKGKAARINQLKLQAEVLNY